MTDMLSLLLDGRPISLTPGDIDVFLSLVRALGNTDLLDLVFDLEDSKPLNASNAVNRLQSKAILGQSTDLEIEFIASHFHSIETDALRRLGIATLERIVTSSSLRISNEDVLFDFICGLDSDPHPLLRYVMSDYLSPTGMARFLEYLYPDNLDLMTWDSLCRRLCLKVTPHPLSSRRQFSTEAVL
jgi:hypothetical protein